MKKSPIPSMDAWLAEAKKHPNAEKIGMYLFHDGVVRESAKAQVRFGVNNTAPVTAMHFSYDEKKLDEVINEAYTLPGIYYVRVWLNEGKLSVGEDIMRVLIGGDIRPHVIDGLQHLVGRIKNECVQEKECY
ncbi:MAG: molybdenum cofactor biosynthesis protein MoaE [Peptococcaceae bacterium]|nr:molybdenum cofactor biosynthesis protein MoaE [Peptococcaceae bacterium]